MVIVGLLPTLLLQVSGYPSAPSAKQLEAACRVALCHEAKTIELRMPQGRPFRFEARTPVPIVMSGIVTILPGETIEVEATRQGDRLVDLKAVASVVHPERTLVFSFRQEPAIGDGTGMVLTAQSPFAGVLKYDLGMMVPDGGDVVGTSSCPLHAGVRAYEHWPHPVFQLFVAKLRFLNPATKNIDTCE
jgi:hypothetical protein